MSCVNYFLLLIPLGHYAHARTHSCIRTHTRTHLHSCVCVRAHAHTRADVNTIGCAPECRSVAMATVATSTSTSANETRSRRQATGCTTASNWVATAVETTPRGTVTHEIFYDATGKRVRWDRSGPVRQAGMDESITTLSLYAETIPKQPPTTKPGTVVVVVSSTKCVCVCARACARELAHHV